MFSSLTKLEMKSNGLQARLPLFTDIFTSEIKQLSCDSVETLLSHNPQHIYKQSASHRFATIVMASSISEACKVILIDMVTRMVLDFDMGTGSQDQAMSRKN